MSFKDLCSWTVFILVYHHADTLSSWDSTHDISESVVDSLWTRQHMLTNIELVDGVNVEKQLLTKPHILKALRRLKSLRISLDPFDHGSSLVAGSLVLQSSPKIDTIILDYSKFGEVGQQLQPEGSEGDDLAQKLFHPFLPRRGAPLSLHRLELTEVDLRWSSQTVAPALEFAKEAPTTGDTTDQVPEIDESRPCCGRY